MNNDSQIKGVPVIAITQGSPSDLAGVRVGDLIVAVDNVAVNNLSDYVERANLRQGSMVLDLLRGNSLVTVVVQPNQDFLK